MNIIVKPSELSGNIRAITSKSYVHRALICALISGKKTNIYCNQLSEDINATANAIKAIGADITYKDSIFTVNPYKEYNKFCTIDCKESGSTLRFILPIICAFGIKADLIMRGRLSERPMSALTDILEKYGCTINKKENILSVSGRLQSGVYEIDGNISSQYITGLIFTLPILKGNSEIIVKGDFQSKSYVNLTLGVLNKFGIEIREENNRYSLCKVNNDSSEIKSEGDWSNGAFWLCAGALSKRGITVTGLDLNSVQGDRKIIDILKDFGAEVSVLPNRITVKKNSLNGITVDASDIPDLVPIISILASFSKGKTVIENIERLRLKESDRVKTTVEMINNLGGKAQGVENSIVIYYSPLNGGTVNSYNDHRIVMSAAVSSVGSKFDVAIINSDAVNKSYPEFFNDFKSLGGACKEEE